MTNRDAVFTSLLIISLAVRIACDDGNGTKLMLDTTGFVDENGDKYEAAVQPACPAACSCLDDYFECRKANLKSVPKLPEWVRSLDLTANKLDESVEHYIANLSQLITLTLKKNRLRQFPVFTGLLSLERLNLANNKIQAITSEPLLSLPNLRSLDLSKNSIRQILPNSFPVQNNLISLNLNYNRLKTLEENSIDSLKALTELQLNFNSLSNLPSGSFKSLGSLKKLFLNGNHLDINWSTFRGLDALQTLKLRSNDIRQLTDGVFHALKSIETIELDSNHIAHLSRQGFYNLTSLRALSLSNNSIVRIEPDTWEFTQLLESLDLSQNNLTEFRNHHLDCLQKLQRLNLASNKIQHLSDATFECVKNLEQLNLSRNKLSWIIEDSSAPFKSLKKLLNLDLSDNNAKSINQKTFIGLTSLKVLNVNGNNLTTVQFNAFESFQALEHLSLKSEHFLCDCNLRWFRDWMKEYTSDTTNTPIVAVCDYPVNLRRQNLLALNETDFMCIPDDSPKPRLIAEPSNQLAIKGTNVSFECSAISSESAQMQIQWRRDNVDINQNETETEMKITPETNGTLISSYLHLYNVSREHTGKYQCVVVNSFGTTYSQKFKITVATYPKFLKAPSNVTIDSGSQARLDCAAFGEPMPQIFWQKDGGIDFPAARERRMQVLQADNSFFILNAKPVDMGVYTCTAQNPAGVITANASLVVNESPSFAKPMKDKEAIIGQTAVLECLANGSPKPHIRWYKNDMAIEQSDRYYFAADRKLLLITDTKPSDAGVYKCEIGNKLDTISGRAALTIVQNGVGYSKNVVNIEEMTGIIIITVFCCAVGTSIVWLVIIYQTKKSIDSHPNQTTMTALTGLHPNCNETSFVFGAQRDHTMAAADSVSSHEDEYRLVMPSGHTMEPGYPAAAGADHLSSKDSGTGSDTIKRSVEEIPFPVTSCSSMCINDMQLHAPGALAKFTRSQTHLNSGMDETSGGSSNVSAPLLSSGGARALICSSLGSISSIAVPGGGAAGTGCSQSVEFPLISNTSTPIRKLAMQSFQPNSAAAASN